jgi:putative ABC transport system permease protein
MPEGGPIVIGWWELALATLFVVASALLSLRLSLKLERDMLVATARTYLQLFALGIVLRWVFENQAWWLTLMLLTVMVVAAARVVLQRAGHVPRGLFGSAVFSMALTGFTVTFAVTALIVRVPVWYDAQYVLPIAGMVIGNSMTGIALAVERLFADMDSRSAEILSLTALGASEWEAARASVRTALTAGLTPTINAMAAVGIVFIPGMMTGQILAGADPVEASKYQVVVMLMICAATSVGAIASVLLMYRRRFTSDGVYLEPGLREGA